MPAEFFNVQKEEEAGHKKGFYWVLCGNVKNSTFAA
jgi:hypothetical protein